MRLLIFTFASLLAAAEEPADGSAGAIAAPERSVDVPLHYLPPGCVSGSGYYNITVPSAYFEYFADSEGSVRSPGVGEGLLYDGRRWLIPWRNLNRYRDVRELIAAPESFERVVLHYDLPVLVGAQEFAFQYPLEGGRDWLEVLEPRTMARGEFPTMQRELMRLALYRNAKGLRVLALEPITMPDGEPISTNLFDYTPSRGVRLRLESEDGDSAVYSIGRLVLRGSRTVAELNRLREESGPRILLHTGSVVRRFSPEPIRSFCAEVLGALGPSATVPGTGDLGLGVERLKSFAERYELPYVAANLAIAADKSRPFPSFTLETLNGLTVAIVGIVTRDEIRGLPLSVRDDWVVENEARALERALEEVRDTLGRRPDLTVLLADGLNTGLWKGVRGIDVALASFSNEDDRYFRTVTELKERPEGITDGSHFEIPAMAVLAGRHSIGKVVAHFEPRGLGRPLRLYRIEHDSFSVLEGGPRETEIEERLRSLEEDQLEVNAEIVLADPASAVENDDELQELVYGQQVLRGDRFVRYDRAFPPVFSDALWMRFVTNTMLLELEGEVALSRNLKRTAMTVGRVQRRYVKDWLRTVDSVRVVALKGSDLQKIAKRIERQTPGSSIPPSQFIFAAGLDSTSKKVRNRPIKPEQRYRVVLTDAVMRLIDDVDFSAYAADERFVSRDGLAFASDEGEPLFLSDLVEQSVIEESARVNPVQQRVFLEHHLENYAMLRDFKWSANVEEMSLRGSRYVNNGSVNALSGSLQTRLTTQDNYNFDLRSRLRATFDGPELAWDNRLRLELSQLVFDSDTGNDRQEPSDDIVFTTELRFNSLQVGVLGSGIDVNPFVQAVTDSEFTPTTNPDTGAENPRQLLLRGLLGLVAQPGSVLSEVRLGAVFERDTVNAINELGLQTSYELRWRLLPELTWESTLEARYFFPSSSDDETTLGLIVQAVNRFLVPVGGLFDFFAYVDLYAARGKVESTRSLGASWDIGAGIDVARLFTTSRSHNPRSSFFERLLE